jgi:hypothetical protein
MKRSTFIRWSAAAAAGLALPFSSCKAKRSIPGRIVGASASAGHMLRDQNFGEPEEFSEVNVIIIGGGISGLSAARYLSQNGVEDVVLMELEMKMGGNSASGGNAVSQYPWGAHYVPLPNNNLSEYLSFLEECKVITGYNDKGLPEYNEYYLCQDPEERLYLNGAWQEGLVPRTGLNASELKQFQMFFEHMQSFRLAKGSDGKDAFAIPVNDSSKDAVFTALDQLTMSEWMEQQGWNNPYINWYVNYCTLDDFGTAFDRISAWTGIHYFASRKGKGVNAAYHDVLTWEDGNGFLAKQLQEASKAKHMNQCVAIAVKPISTGVEVHYFDVADKKLKGIRAKHCILSVPQFVAARLLKDTQRMQLVKEYLHYTPWLVANLTVGQLQERSGAPRSWDNVIYGGAGLGYVDATHQQVQQYKPKQNLTYYKPLSKGNPADARKQAMTTTHEQWVNEIVADLKVVHPDIEEQVEQIDVMLWGHAMAQPLPGLITGDVRTKLAESIDGSIHFAHTDLAGISIFEEAFYQGLLAAKKITGNHGTI